MVACLQFSMHIYVAMHYSFTCTWKHKHCFVMLSYIVSYTHNRYKFKHIASY